MGQTGGFAASSCLSDRLLAQRRAFFCFVFFVATKKMTLLSGNPDGFAFVFGVKSSTENNNRLTICCAQNIIDSQFYQ